MGMPVRSAESRSAAKRPGLALMVAGGALAVGSVGSALFDPLWVLMLVGFLCLAYGIPGLHRVQAPADGFAGRWGALLVPIGAAVMVLLGLVFLIWEAVGNAPQEGPVIVDVAWMTAFAIFVVGVLLFAVGVIKAQKFPRFAGVLILVGLVAAVGIDMLTGAFFEDEGGTTEWGFYLGLPVFAIGLAWLGYAAWGRERSERPAVEATTHRL
jgi:hypothetical protein